MAVQSGLSISFCWACELQRSFAQYEYRVHSRVSTGAHPRKMARLAAVRCTRKGQSNSYHVLMLLLLRSEQSGSPASAGSAVLQHVLCQLCGKKFNSESALVILVASRAADQ